MSIATFLKNNLESIPLPIGKLLARIPYAYRPGIGREYKKNKNDISCFSNFTLEQKKNYIYNNIKKIVTHAYNNIPFYQEYYSTEDFNPEKDLKSFEDIKKIPMINKSMLQKFDLEYRSYLISNRYIVNTAGSTGKPLDLYVQPNSMGIEWAHMHTVWSKLGFNYKDLKLTLVGRNTSSKIITYDAVRHSFNLNIYANYNIHSEEIFNTIIRNKIKYLHGYPSAIYEFAKFCSELKNRERLDEIKMNIEGVFLGSEFPIKKWRDFIEKIFECNSISWYGHTERLVLAYEKQKYEYTPFHTYGYTEIETIDGNDFLIGTTYSNFATPLIRYNTEDVVRLISKEDELVDKFDITGGRIGEFILDHNRKKISLTGLIFGRHHKLFDFSNHIQIFQKNKGTAIILFCNNSERIKRPELLFNSENVAIDFEFKQIPRVIKTKSGKINLLIKESEFITEN